MYIWVQIRSSWKPLVLYNQQKTTCLVCVCVCTYILYIYTLIHTYWSLQADLRYLFTTYVYLFCTHADDERHTSYLFPCDVRIPIHAIDICLICIYKNTYIFIYIFIWCWQWGLVGINMCTPRHVIRVYLQEWCMYVNACTRAGNGLD